ncbi:MAG: hypothetical protein ACLFSC_09750 [Wenzhouxiangella sp.]
MNIPRTFVIAVFMLLVMPVNAAVLPTTTPGPQAARVSGVQGQVLKDRFGVRFVGIDGQNISPREVMWLEPGRYELTVTIDAAYFKPPVAGIRRSRQQSGANTIEVELEAGKTYQIRGFLDRDAEVENALSVILWKVEERDGE